MFPKGVSRSSRTSISAHIHPGPASTIRSPSQPGRPSSRSLARLKLSAIFGS
jgi:hypothetical protein